MSFGAVRPPTPAQPWDDALALLPRRRPRTFARDQIIYAPDDAADSLLLVVDGAVKISRFPGERGEMVLDVEARESFFGVSSLLGAANRREQAVALERSAVMEWFVDELRDLMGRAPELAPALLKVFARKLIDAETRIETFASDQIPRRLLKALLRFGTRLGESDPDDERLRLPPLTHDLLAKHIGTSREIITQHMNRLKKRGLLDYSLAGLEFSPSILRTELTRTR